MKKLLAILLTLILSFSCFSLLGTGVAVAEEETTSEIIMQSDFGNTTSTNLWQVHKGTVEQGLQDTDGTYYARLTSSETNAPSFYSAPATLTPGYKYELSYYIRVPETSAAYKGTLTTETTDETTGETTTTSTNYNLTPKLAIYESGISSAGKVNTLYYSVNNEYAYNGIRRNDFEADLTVGSYETKQISKYSLIESNQLKSVYGSELSFNEVFADWTKITFAFTAIASDTNAGEQVVGLNFSLTKVIPGLMYDIKDVKLVCTDDGTATKTIMQSDFNDADGTNWQATKTGVLTYGDDNSDGVNDYARVKVHPTSKNQGIVSTPFELVPGNDYELTYYIRVPEESVSFTFGSTFYAPTVAFYQTTVNSTGTKVTATPTIATDEATNNLYAYKYTNDDPTQNWARRLGFSATWTIDGYTPKVITNFSDFDYRYYTAVLGATNADLNEAFEDWTKVTVNFTAVANTEDEKSQVTAVGFYYGDYKSENNLVFDIKDVALTETASKIQPEPDTTNAIFYEGFEDITQTELEALITNRSSWANVGLDTSDAATGKKAASVYAMWDSLFIPIDKSLIDTSTFYEFSMDWKLKVPTEAKKSALTNLAIVGYNPSQGETIEANAKSLSYKENLYGTGDWENTTLRFKISDLDSYEQFGILIKYSGSEPYDSTDTLYIDTLMIAPAEDQSEVTELNLNEQERTDDTIKVLAFGNSFSDDATVYIDDIAKADGKDLRVANCAKGGCSLAQHYNYMLNSTEAYSFGYYTKDAERQYFSGVTMQQALAASDWDYIVIQQVSQNSGMSDTFEPYLAELLAYFEEQCPDAEILFHTTWAYAANSTHSGFANYDNDQSTMHEAIEDAYLEASARYGYARLIPTGEAIRIARATSMGDNFNRDGYHLNDKGRMVAALTWYETFTGISALDTEVDLTTLTGTVGETGGITGFVTADESAIIKAAAHEAAARFKLANETQLAIEAIGEVTADSGEAIENAKALRTELNDDGLLPNLQTLIDAIEAFESLGTETNLPGDFTGSGTVDLEDVTVLAKLFAGWNVETVSTSLDLNGDGAENLKDLVLLAQYVAGWDVTLS